MPRHEPGAPKRKGGIKKRLSTKQQALMKFLSNHRGGIEFCNIPPELVKYSETLGSLQKRQLVKIHGPANARIITPQAHAYTDTTPGASIRTLPGQLRLPKNYAIMAFRVGAERESTIAPCVAVFGPAEPKEKFQDSASPLKHLVRHSPTGLNFGYAGSGPADLALSVLTLLYGDWAEPFYQRFMRDCIEPEKGWVWAMKVSDIHNWFTEASAHHWHQREIRLGRDAGTELPKRCTKCGKVYRKRKGNGPDRNGLCVALPGRRKQGS